MRWAKSGKFGERPWLTKLTPSKLVLAINILLADLLIRQTFFRQILEKSQFTKFPPRQTFPLYNNLCIAECKPRILFLYEYSTLHLKLFSTPTSSMVEIA